MSPVFRLILAVALIIGVASLGALGGGGYATARCDARIARIQGEHARERESAVTELAAAAEAARQALAAEVVRGNDLAAQLQADRAGFEAERKSLQAAIRDVTTQYQPAPGADLRPIPPCIITRGWLRDYNAAIGADLSGADPAAPGGGTGSASIAAAGADAGLLLDSGVTPADILAHIVDYGSRCQGYAAQANRLIDRWEVRQ
ncbi:lysis protein [Thauera sinica]|uniref:Lysis protein n=1 Tax=Thauera sinica TaxID=2665146 RepID=A0ABW1ARA3_9RHOO|nr:lysis protein [Thauera sp. K11]ATE60150.1 lysis protein [Thauera sp. K11]